MVNHGRDKSLSPEISRLSNLLLKNPASRLFVPLAEAYYKSGMHEEALFVLTDGIRRHPTFVAALVMLGKIYLQTGNRAKAREQFEAAVRINPENIPSLKHLAAIYQEENAPDRARETYQAILRIDPTDKAARRLVTALTPEAAEADADVEMQEALPARGEDAGDAAVSVSARAEAGEKAPEAEPGGSEGERSTPGKTLATPTLAALYMRQGCYREAAGIYNTLLARDPGDAESRRGLEAALARLQGGGQPDDAPSSGVLRARKIARLEAWLETLQRGGGG